MNTLEAIRQRKSVRKFQDKPVPAEAIEDILQAGMEAPSTKNSQPWKYYVIQGKAKDTLVGLMNEGLHSFGDEQTLQHLPFYASVLHTIKVMGEAPAIILVFNTGLDTLNSETTLEARFMDCGAMQQMGATIQNMLLAATEHGLGSLWMCDVFFAYYHICNWLGEKSQLAAGIALGYEDGNHPKPPRGSVNDHTVFMEG
jgi:nitroreductase